MNLRPVLSKQTDDICMTRLQKLFANTHKQYGFRPKHSTAHQLLGIVEFIYDGFENLVMIIVLFFDAMKALYTVSQHLQTDKYKHRFDFPTPLMFLIHFLLNV